MNYVSHYFCAENQNAYHCFGLMAPDLFPKFSFYHNQFFLKFDVNNLDIDERYIWNGIEQHYRDDAFFHAMPEFKQWTNVIEVEMKKTELKDIKRQFLVSHILYELILDNMILERFPDMVARIYRDVDTIPRRSIELFLEKIMQNNSQISVFLEAYDRFMERRFLNFYSEERNLVKALHRVTGKIGNWEYNESTESAFISIIQYVKSGIDFDFTFEQIQSHI